MGVAVGGELVGGLLLVLGFETLGALALFGFLLGVTPLMHDFWVHDPASAEFQGQFINFFKNVAIAGAMLLILSPSPAPRSTNTSGKQKRR